MTMKRSWRKQCFGMGVMLLLVAECLTLGGCQTRQIKANTLSRGDVHGSTKMNMPHASTPLENPNVRLSVACPQGVTFPEHADYDALVFVNYDHDGTQAPDKSDCDDETINGDEDRGDMATVKLESLKEIDDSEFMLFADKPERLRLFDEKERPVRFQKGGVYALGTDRLRKGKPLAFLAEGVKPGVVNITLRRVTSSGRVSGKDTLRIVVGVELLLTFDDGPLDPIQVHGAKNHTMSILETLRDAGNGVRDKNIKACFFVISEEPSKRARETASSSRHEIADSVRASRHREKEILFAEHRAGHLIGYHRRANQEYAGGANAGLADDIAAFKTYFADIGLPAPVFARPPNWQHDSHTDAAYRAEMLGLIMTDVHPRDGGFGRNGNGKAWGLVIRRILRKGTRDRVNEGMGQVVLTLHDVNRTTAKILPRYLRDALKGGKAARMPEGATVFVTDTSRLRELLDMKARKNHFAYNPTPSKRDHSVLSLRLDLIAVHE